MIQPTRLHIRLTPGPLRPQTGAASINELRGGPETLLRWLETQLGLPAPEASRASRVTGYASALDSSAGPAISGSLANDRWATASELLSRRDELRLGGWDGNDSGGLPDVVREMARAGGGTAFPGEADRLDGVAGALDGGQELPGHACLLEDPVDRWPVRWQAVLRRLNLAVPAEPPPAAPEGTALRAAQDIVRGGGAPGAGPDPSLRHVRTLSETAAVEFVAATLAHARGLLERTVILCEDDHLAMRLDACLSRRGLPTTGASSFSRAHPALQVLPLGLALCWRPVDPQALMDFLALPVGPIPRGAAAELAAALTEEPGLGSGAWQRCHDRLCSAANDPDGRLRGRLDEWLNCGRAARGGSIPTELVRDRCASVARWASSRAGAMEAGGAGQPHLVHALRAAAGQAALLGELAQSQGGGLREPQLARLVEEALSSGVEAAAAPEAAGGPIRVRSLAEIVDPCQRLIWLGIGTADAPSCRWSADQRQALRGLGIVVDDGANPLASLRAAEARGLCLVGESLLAILLPRDAERRWHPLWLAARKALAPGEQGSPPLLEELIEGDRVASLGPFTFPTGLAEVEPPQPARPVWVVDRALLGDRDTASATELEDRLACPLKWVFRHRAQLRPGPIAQLPDDRRLKGTFCHRVLELAFGGGGDLPTVDAAVKLVGRLFDERLELDAAPLARPGKARERQALRGELCHATRVLIGALAEGKYRITGIEVEVRGEAFGKPLRGSIDCLASRGDGAEAIIDFKYGGRKYERMVADGRAVQLATYAFSRSLQTGRFPEVAYLVLSDGHLLTPSGGPVGGGRGCSVVEGPGIEVVWERFRAAIQGAEDWLTADGRVPARPLQDPDDWPAGSGIVLESKLGPDQRQSVCSYCDYQHLCGLRRPT
jgi:ATP-dependent helicase/nuclease subunit B